MYDAVHVLLNDSLLIVYADSWGTLGGGKIWIWVTLKRVERKSKDFYLARIGLC